MDRSYHAGVAEEPLIEAPPAEEPRGLAAPYDDIADGYAAHWGPVIRPAAERVLDLLETPARGAAMLDIGSGTGVLAVEALRRWPSLHVTAIDASAEMLAHARRESEARLAPGATARLTTRTALADDLPFRDATFDVAVSSFVLQLVPSRIAALREARRVLRPGAPIAWVTWLTGGSRFRGDVVANEVLDDFGFDPAEPESRSGDPTSVDAAVASTRRAGFRHVVGRADEVVHPWDPATYLDFLTKFDEASLFDDLATDERAEIEEAILRRLQRLSAEEMTLRLPIVYVRGRAS